MSMKETQLWNLQYVLTLLVNMMINVSSIILIAVLPLFTIAIGGNNSQAGLLMTVLAVSAVMCRPLFGRMLDVRGRKIVLMIGLILFSLSTLFLVISSNIFLLFTVRFIQGIGLSAFTTALGTILSDNLPASRVGEGVGYFGVSSTIAMAVGPSLGLYWMEKVGYSNTYVITFLIGGVSVILAAFLRERKKSGMGLPVDEKLVGVENRESGGFIEKTAIKPCIVVLFTVLAVSSVFSFMPLFAKERNIDNIGLFFTVYAISMILTRMLSGKAADRFGHMKVFLPSIIITFLLFVTLAFSYSLYGVMLAGVFYGVGYGTVQAIMNTIVIQLSPLERRGAANATYYATMDIGFGIGSLLWGVISQYAGFTMVFLASALFIVVAVILNYVLLYPILKHQ